MPRTRHSRHGHPPARRERSVQDCKRKGLRFLGVWGTGLYSGDFALDLRSVLAALCRLPMDGDAILRILREHEPAADDPRHEEYTTFWLIVADQFHKRGVVCPKATGTALSIITDGSDSSMLRRLGMKEPDLRKREARLALLKRDLLAGPVAKQRRTLKRPQEFIMDAGDVFVYPTSNYKPLNPFLKRREDNYARPFNWVHDGWGAMAILNKGRTFGYLAWYALLVLDNTYPDKPTLDQLMHQASWVVTPPGTCSSLELRRMEVERVAHLDIDPNAAARFHPAARSCTNATVSNISLANHMRARPVMTSKGPWPMVEHLADVLSAGGASGEK